MHSQRPLLPLSYGWGQTVCYDNATGRPYLIDVDPPGGTPESSLVVVSVADVIIPSKTLMPPTPNREGTPMNETTTPSHDNAEPSAPQPGDTIRAKWAIDGATTLAEAADKLEQMSAWLRHLHQLGWTLSAPVEDDYGFLVDPSGDAGDAAEDTDEDI